MPHLHYIKTMKKQYVYLIMVSLFILQQNKAHAQILKTATGIVSFTSKTDFLTFEAINNQVSAAYSKGKMQFRVPVNAFIFERKLMQTHFQENYMESAKYPNGSFKGTVVSPENFKPSAKVQNVKVKGIFSIHGVDKETEVVGTIVQTNKGMELKADFSILLIDYNIDIPSTVVNKISPTVDIQVETLLSEK